jgi:transcriptional regulator with XRE-family HTH domain
VWINPEAHKVVGRTLAELRRQKNVTQSELAAFLEKPQSFVSAYEDGQRRVDLLEFIRITGALSADPLTIFSTIVAAAKAD